MRSPRLVAPDALTALSGRPVTIASLAAQNSRENGSLLPPKAPPIGGWITRMRAGEILSTRESSRCR